MLTSERFLYVVEMEYQAFTPEMGEYTAIHTRYILGTLVDVLIYIRATTEDELKSHKWNHEVSFKRLAPANKLVVYP